MSQRIQVCTLPADKGQQLLLSRKLGEITGYEYFLSKAAGGIFDQGIVFSGTKNNTYWWVIARAHFVGLIVVQIYIHLPGIGMVNPRSSDQ